MGLLAKKISRALKPVERPLLAAFPGYSFRGGYFLEKTAGDILNGFCFSTRPGNQGSYWLYAFSSPLCLETGSIGLSFGKRIPPSDNPSIYSRTVSILTPEGIQDVIDSMKSYGLPVIARHSTPERLLAYLETENVPGKFYSVGTPYTEAYQVYFLLKVSQFEKALKLIEYLKVYEKASETGDLELLKSIKPDYECVPELQPWAKLMISQVYAMEGFVRAAKWDELGQYLEEIRTARIDELGAEDLILK